MLPIPYVVCGPSSLQGLMTNYIHVNSSFRVACGKLVNRVSSALFSMRLNTISISYFWTILILTFVFLSELQILDVRLREVVIT